MICGRYHSIESTIGAPLAKRSPKLPASSIARHNDQILDPILGELPAIEPDNLFSSL